MTSQILATSGQIFRVMALTLEMAEMRDEIERLREENERLSAEVARLKATRAAKVLLRQAQLLFHLTLSLCVAQRISADLTNL